jgi:hypothetical protein
MSEIDELRRRAAELVAMESRRLPIRIRLFLIGVAAGLGLASAVAFMSE